MEGGRTPPMYCLTSGLRGVAVRLPGPGFTNDHQALIAVAAYDSIGRRLGIALATWPAAHQLAPLLSAPLIDPAYVSVAVRGTKNERVGVGYITSGSKGDVNSVTS